MMLVTPEIIMRDELEDICAMHDVVMLILVIFRLPLKIAYSRSHFLLDSPNL